MLFPVILFGVVWTDLNRPVTQAEVDRVERLWKRSAQLDLVTTAYYFVKGRVLSARIRNGMRAGQVGAIMGCTSGGIVGLFHLEGCSFKGHSWHHYCPTGLVVEFDVRGTDRPDVWKEFVSTIELIPYREMRQPHRGE